jgi:hypothetical protein
VALKYQKLSSI